MTIYGQIVAQKIKLNFVPSEVNSTWLITSKLANQRARKIISTSAVKTNGHSTINSANEYEPGPGFSESD